MNEPLLVFRKKNNIMIFSFFLIFILFALIAREVFLQHGFSLLLVFILVIGTTFSFFAILDNLKCALYVYHDHFTETNLQGKIDISFSDIYHIRYFKKAASKNSNTENKISNCYLLFENENNKIIKRMDFSLFQTKEDVTAFITFIKQYHSHISFDLHVQKMLQGRFKLPNTNPYIILIFMIVFDSFVLSFFLEWL